MTENSANLVHRNPLIDMFYVAQKCRVTDYEALKFLNVRPGNENVMEMMTASSDQKNKLSR